jgi:hypothetical protein
MVEKKIELGLVFDGYLQKHDDGKKIYTYYSIVFYVQPVCDRRGEL